jgi:limonene-1,2-epoxide hydrolase
MDTKLGTERTDEKCGKGLWGRGVVCGAFYRVVGGKVRGWRRLTAVGFELVGFDIDSGSGVDGAPS